MGRRARGALAALLAGASLSLALSACGGSDPSAAELSQAKDRLQIEAAAKRFAAAVEDKDAKAFCALLSPEDKKRLRYEERRCLVVWGPKQNPLFKAKNPNLALKEVTKVKLPNATAKLANGGELVFLQEDGAWYVNLAPAKK